MNNRMLLYNMDDVETKVMAPVIPLRQTYTSIKTEQKKITRLKVESSAPPSFYTRPIFKTKKYDLL